MKATSSLSFFLVRRAKRARHANDHARDWSEEKERLFAVYGFDLLQLFLFLYWYPGLIQLQVTS